MPTISPPQESRIKILKEWKDSSEYQQLMSLMATYHWGEQLYNCYNAAMGKTNLKGPWAPIVSTLKKSPDGKYQMKVINTLTRKVEDISMLSTDDLTLSGYLSFQAFNPVEIGSNNEYKNQNIEVGYKSIFATLKASESKDENAPLPSSELAAAIKLQTYLGLRTKGGVKIASQVLSVAWAAGGIIDSATLTEKTAINLEKALGVTSQAIDLAFSLFNLGLDVFQFVNTEDSFQRSVVATQIGFDTVSSALTFASIGAGLVASFAVEGSATALGAALVGATLGPVGVVATGVGIGAVGLVKAFGKNEDSYKNVVQQLQAINKAYKKGGFEYLPENQILRPIAGAVIKKMNLINGQVEYGYQGVDVISNWDGERVTINNLPVYRLADPPLQLRKAMGNDVNSGSITNFEEAKALILPFSPTSDVYPYYNLVCSGNGSGTPEESSLRKHKILLLVNQGGQWKKAEALIWRFADTPVDVYLNKNVSLIQVPELPRHLYYSNNGSSEDLTGGFTYTLYGLTSSYQINLENAATIVLVSDEVNPAATQWTLYDAKNALKDSDFKWDKNTLQIGGSDGPKVRGDKTSPNTVSIIDKNGDQRIIDFISFKVSPTKVVNAGKYQKDAKSLKSHLEEIYKQQQNVGIITINNYQVDGKAVGRAWYEGSKKRIIYTLDSAPSDHKQLKNNAQFVSASDTHFFCYDGESQLIWKVKIDSHQVVEQYLLLYRNTKSSLRSVSINGNSLAIAQDHELANGNKLVFIYQLINNKLTITTLLGKLSDIQSIYQTSDKDGSSSIERRLLDLIQKGNAPVVDTKFEGQNIKLLNAEMGTFLTLIAQEDNNKKALHKSWIIFEKNKRVALTLDASAKQTGDGYNSDGIPNDLVLAGTVSGTNKQDRYYFYSQKFQKLYAQGESQTYGQNIPAENLTNVAADHGQIFTIQKNGNMHMVLPDDTLSLVAVGKKWISKQNQWWKNLGQIDLLHNASFNRIALLLGITKSDKNIKTVPGWYHRDFQRVLFSPLSDSAPDLRFQGFSKDGKGAWFFDDGTSKAYYQPTCTDAILAKAFTATDTTVLANPQAIPKPKPILEGESIIETRNIDGDLVLTIVKIVEYPIFNPGEGGGNEEIDKLTFICTGTTKKIIQITLPENAYKEPYKFFMIRVKEWLNKYPHNNVIRLLYKEDVVFGEEKIRGWFNTVTFNLIDLKSAAMPYDETAFHIGDRSYDKPKDGVGMDYIYSPKNQMLYECSNNVMTPVIKAKEVRKVGRSLFIAINPSAESQVLPIIDDIDYVYIYSEKGEQVYEIPKEAWGHYKGIIINNWSSDQTKDSLLLQLPLMNQPVSITQENGAIIFRNNKPKSTFVALMNAMDIAAEDKASSNIDLIIKYYADDSSANQMKKASPINIKRIALALSYNLSDPQIGKEGIITSEKEQISIGPNSFIYKEKETQREYPLKELQGNLWMAKDFKGSLIPWSETSKVPMPWRLPKMEEWSQLATYYYSEEEKNKALLQGGTSGLNLTFVKDSESYYFRKPYPGEQLYGDAPIVAMNKKHELKWEEEYYGQPAYARYLLPKFNYQTFTDSRDNQKYRFIEIELHGVKRKLMIDNFNYADKKTEGESWIYKDSKGDSADPKNESRLYTLAGAKAAAPKDWGLLKNEDWLALINKYSSQETTAEKGSREAYWALIDGGKSGFSVRLEGKRSSDGNFVNKDVEGAYWTDSDVKKGEAYCYSFSNQIVQQSIANPLVGLSARFIYPDFKYFTDPRDGQNYPIKEFDLGGGKKRTWMLCDLVYYDEKTMKGKSWKYHDADKVIDQNGRLYTQDIAQFNNIAPPGWHIATDQEWKEFLSQDGLSFEDLIAANGLQINLGGCRNDNGQYEYHGQVGVYWAKSSSNDIPVYGFERANAEGPENPTPPTNPKDARDIIRKDGFVTSKKFGLSLRCVKDY